MLFVWDAVPPELVAIAAGLALYATHVITASELASGFGDPAVIFIAAMFVISESLEATGITTWAGEALMARFGARPKLMIVLMFALGALLSALITPNGAVAALVPMVVVMSRRIGYPPSTVLMGLAFSAITGSLLVLTGSPVNVLIAEAAQRSDSGHLSYFSFGLVGLPLVLGTIAICAALGSRLIPKRKPRTITADLSAYARTLTREYDVDRELLDEHDLGEQLLDRETGAAEVVVPPRSELIGERYFPGMVTDSGDLVVLAIKRNGRPVAGEQQLLAGDTLLLGGEWTDLDQHIHEPEVLVVNEPNQILRQAVPLGPGAWRALAILAALVIVLAAGVMPPFVAALGAAGALVLFRVVNVEAAYRAISWTTVLLVGGMFAVSVAVTKSGAAEQIANALISAIGSAGPHALLIGLFLITFIFGQLISSTATALVMIPIAESAANKLGVSALPVLMSVAVATTAAFLTPIATPANLIVMGPAGYRFGDYWKLGLCVSVLTFVIAVWLVPVFWSF